MGGNWPIDPPYRFFADSGQVCNLFEFDMRAVRKKSIYEKITPCVGGISAIRGIRQNL